MLKNPDNIESMLKMMANKKPHPGRPRQDRLSQRKLVRLTPTLEAAVELHRKAMEQRVDEPVDFSTAMRDLVRKGAEHLGYIQPPKTGSPADFGP